MLIIHLDITFALLFIDSVVRKVSPDSFGFIISICDSCGFIISLPFIKNH